MVGSDVPSRASGSLTLSRVPPLPYHSAGPPSKLLSAAVQPFVYRHGLVNPKLIIVPDSSLGNNSKYSQGGYVILLAGETKDFICGQCSVIGFKSAKSKRVASSTLHAETLALVAACD